MYYAQQSSLSGCGDQGVQRKTLERVLKINEAQKAGVEKFCTYRVSIKICSQTSPDTVDDDGRVSLTACQEPEAGRRTNR